MKDSFVLYAKYEEHFALLESDEQGRLIMAIFQYQRTGVLPELSGMTKMAFSFIKSDLDKDRQKWEDTCRKRAEAGSKGGKQKVANLANAIFAKTNVANVADSECEYDSDIKRDSSSNTRAMTEILKVYSENIDVPKPIIIEELLSYLDEGKPPDLIIHAITIAVQASKRSWQYVKGILDRWDEGGIKTVQDAMAEQERFKRQRGKPTKTTLADKKAYEQHQYTPEDIERQKLAALRQLEELDSG